jgi:hypothetical protein
MSNHGNFDSTQTEWLEQERALEQLRRGARPSGSVGEDAYRRVFQALAQLPQSEPPADFAAATARAIREMQIDEHIERWMIRIAGLLGVVAVLVVAGPLLVESFRSSAAMALLPPADLLGSPLLWAAAAGAVTASAFDVWQRARHADRGLVA